MAKKKSSSRGTRGGAGGKTPSSEPKLQVFRDFAGVNFEHAIEGGGVEPDLSTYDNEQTDLQMNYVFLQNNVMVTSNRTLETRNDIVSILKIQPGSNKTFTGPICIIGRDVYIARSDGALIHTFLQPDDTEVVVLDNDGGVITNNVSGSSGHTWESFLYFDGKLKALTRQNEMWSGLVEEGSGDSHVVEMMSNYREVPTPTSDFSGELVAYGDLTLGMANNDTTPFRISICHTYINANGPSLPSPNTTFYASKPVSEWNSEDCVVIKPDQPAPSGYGITAAELYFTTDNSTSMIFLDRVNVGSSGYWSYKWFGYMDATDMWPISNLIVPTENYTKGVHASRMTVIDGRVYYWGDSERPYRLYIGGNPGNLFSVSPGTGGGFVDVEPGTLKRIKHVCKYKTQSGNSIVTMLCDSPNSSQEQRFNLVENSISLSNEQSMKSWQAEQVAGAVGCKSYEGALVCEDGLYAVSRYGLALTTMTMEYNSQIRVNYVSDPIKPVFVDSIENDSRLGNAKLINCDGVLYMALGNASDEDELDNVLFCYDIDQKAWWTYTIDTDETILNLIHIDNINRREGIGIVTSKHVYLLPTTNNDSLAARPAYHFLIQTAEISTQMPQQAWQYLSQLEFHFDYLIGNFSVNVKMIDMFGREIEVDKSVIEGEMLHNYTLRMRIDQRVMSYVITMMGWARFRMTHFIARVYTMSNKIGMVWGFDDSISHRSSGSVRPTFKCYNDVRDAIFT